MSKSNTMSNMYSKHMVDRDGNKLFVGTAVRYRPAKGQKIRSGVVVEQSAASMLSRKIDVKLQGDPFAVQLDSRNIKIDVVQEEETKSELVEYYCPACGRKQMALSGSTLTCTGPKPGAKHVRFGPVTMKLSQQEKGATVATDTKAKPARGARPARKTSKTAAQAKPVKKSKSTKAKADSAKTTKKASSAKTNGRVASTSANPYKAEGRRAFVFDLLVKGGSVSDLAAVVVKTHPVKVRAQTDDIPGYIRQEAHGLVKAVVRDLQKWGFDVTKDGRGDEAKVSVAV